MDNQLIQFLALLYAGINFLNVLISLWLWWSNRTMIYTSLLLMWVGSFLAFAGGGATQGQHLLVFVLLGITPGCFFAGWAASRITLKFINEKPDHVFLLKVLGAGTASSVLLFLLGSPFVIYAFPAGVVMNFPHIYALYRLFQRKEKKLTRANIGFVVMCLIMVLHGLDFPFLGNRPDMVFVGFLIGLLIAFGLTMFGPMVIVEMSAAEAAEIKKELEVTLAVQSLLLPKQSDFDLPSLHLRSYYRPAAKAGGDWWWHDRTVDGRVRLLVGDVTGHGSDSAMVTALMASSYQMLVQINPQTPGTVILEELNKSMIKACEGKYLMTMALLEIQTAEKRFRWAVAGAPSFYHLSTNGKVEVFGGRSSPLGSQKFEASSGEGTFGTKDKLLLFTDGVTDLQMRDGRPLGEKRWLQFFSRTSEASATSTRDQLVTQLEALYSKGSAEDDVTLVVLEHGS